MAESQLEQVEAIQSDQLRVTRRERVWVAQINRVENGNRLSAAVLEALADTVRVASADLSSSALVVTGTADSFSNGGQIDGFARRDVDQQARFCEAYAELVSELDSATIPIVAAVNGQCEAAGMTLLLASDLAVASSRATFGYPEIRAGLFPMLAMAHAVRALPRKVAFEMFYEGRLLTAQEALELNLINAVVDHDKLLAEVERRLESLAQCDRRTIGLGRRLYASLTARNQAQDMALARGALIELLAGRDPAGSAWA